MTGVLGSRRAGTFAAMVVVGAAALAGCAESGGAEGSGGGEGIEADASMEDYQAAFEDVDEITLLTQTPAPKGSATGLPQEEYYAAVEEWSGGKIKFDVAYSNAVAEVTESDEALTDGRLDIASVLPIYDPSEYPANTALIEAGFISDQSAVEGVFSSNAWPNEVAFATDEIMAEFDDHGMVPMVPVYNSGSQGLFCSEERADLDTLDGVSVSSSGTAQTKEIEALGAAATSIAYTELFESLQRGVVDCAAATPTVGVLGGFLDEAPYGVIDPEAGFALAPGALAFSKTTWESLPLVAQQLLWDRLDVFVEANILSKIFPNNAEAVSTVLDAGGQIREFEPDARAALQEANQNLLDEIGGTEAIADGEAFVSTMETTNEEWQALVAELGFDEVDYEGFPDWWEANKDSIDLGAYSEQFHERILAEHRPS